MRVRKQNRATILNEQQHVLKYDAPHIHVLSIAV